MNEPCYYRISVKAIVYDAAGRFLLTREDNGKWELLGGGLEHGEDPHDGLRREIAEEAGLEAIYISAEPKFFITTPGTHSTPPPYLANVIYEVKLKNLDFVPSEECQELRFFSITDAMQVDLFPNVEKLLTLLAE